MNLTSPVPFLFFLHALSTPRSSDRMASSTLDMLAIDFPSIPGSAACVCNNSSHWSVYRSHCDKSVSIIRRVLVSVTTALIGQYIGHVVICQSVSSEESYRSIMAMHLGHLCNRLMHKPLHQQLPVSFTYFYVKNASDSL